MYEKEKEDLGMYLKYKCDVDVLEDKIRSLRASIESIGSQSPDGEHTDGGLHKTRSETIAQLVDYEDEWCAMLRKAETECLKIKHKIEFIKEQNYYAGMILEYKYIKGLNKQEIATQLGYCYRQISRLMNEGLRIYSIQTIEIQEIKSKIAIMS